METTPRVLQWNIFNPQCKNQDAQPAVFHDKHLLQIDVEKSALFDAGLENSRQKRLQKILGKLTFTV